MGHVKMFKNLVIYIVFSLCQGINYFVPLTSIRGGFFNNVFSGVSVFADSYAPNWVPSNWNPFYLFKFSPLLTKYLSFFRRRTSKIFSFLSF